MTELRCFYKGELNEPRELRQVAAELGWKTTDYRRIARRLVAEGLWIECFVWLADDTVLDFQPAPGGTAMMRRVRPGEWKLEN